MSRRSFYLLYLLPSIAICALLLAVVHRWGPTDYEEITVAYGVEPKSQFLATLVDQILESGYASSERPSCIFCCEGDWKWYRKEIDPSITIGIDFEQHDCQITIWYERPRWLPVQFGNSEIAARNVAQDLELRMQNLLVDLPSSDEAVRLDNQVSDETSFMIGPFYRSAVILKLGRSQGKRNVLLW